MQLELQGVFLADEAEPSSVIVAERNRDGQLYRKVGDRLPGNAVLVEVFGDRIVPAPGRPPRRSSSTPLPAAPSSPASGSGGGTQRSARAAEAAVRRASGHFPAEGLAHPLPKAGSGQTARVAARDRRRDARPTSMRERLEDLARLNVDPTPRSPNTACNP